MTTENPAKRSYKETLNLPATPFAMKANLVTREPEFQKRWSRIDVYNKLRSQPRSRGKFILHDGPPYANGSIHLGHLLNKVLKDLVVRSRSMLGFDAPFVPGWDCHGLPIEHKVMKDLGSKARSMTTEQIRQLCKADADKFINTQRDQMIRLGTIADYEHPYKTMAPEYEAATLEVFADLVKAGLVYRSLKPVHWSIENRTALAEAELEYQDRVDTSVFVLFPVANPQDLPASMMARPGTPIHLMIWTTTPWTLPANLAVAASPTADYVLYKFHVGDREAMAIMARDLGRKVLGMVEGASFTQLGSATGAELMNAGIKYQHPFIDRINPLLTADYVTLEDGTGLVHTAPGHGVEDYQTGLKYNLPIYCPVLENGTFDDTAPEFLRGKRVWDANDLVVENLRASGHLFHDNKFSHSYPHDWRSKTPVIFRATEQWFAAVDKPDNSLRAKALSVTESNVKFLPEWGRNRMRGMLESRPDWCLSRQRAWGLPIPAFFGPEKGQVLLTPASIAAVSKKFRAAGSDLWFTATAQELLADYKPDADPDAPYWIKSELANPQSTITKGGDTFDVWFESGSSWHSVLQQRGLPYPADLYLEGSDQHRGWFQHSLLPALGVTGQSPFKAVLTHGFMVDKNGEKISKSKLDQQSHIPTIEQLFTEYGADIARWWVASVNTDNDIKVDKEFFRLGGEEYRKVRNTIRYLLSNLSDFNNATDRREMTAADRFSPDQWALQQLAILIDTARGAYEAFDFRTVQQSIFNFCNDAMSAVYVVATKDRLYCDRKNSDRRRRTQTVMYDTASALIRLMAPILVHTADEAWLALTNQTMDSGDTVHLHELPQHMGLAAEPAWEALMLLRQQAAAELEAKIPRQPGSDTKKIDPLDVALRAHASGETAALLKNFDPTDLADLLNVSRFEITRSPDNAPTIFEVLDLRNEPQCERSWKRDGTVKQRSDGAMLSNRDAEAIGV